MTTAYQQRRPELHHDRIVFPASERQSLDLRLADAVRQIREGAEGLSSRESQLLSDVSRRTYSGFRVVTEIADIARHRCKDPAKAAALAEAVREYTLFGHPGLSLPFFDTLRYEGTTNQMADDALLEHVLSPSKATAERLVETHVAQAIASRAVADLVYQRERR